MTPEQIQRRQTAWTVLRYEREMYEATFKLMHLNLHKMFHYTMVNAFVESHSLHIRNLCNFLVANTSEDDDALDYTDLVERFEEVDIDPLNKVWYTPIEGHPGSPAFVLQVMSDCTIHRRNTYDYNSIAMAIHGPLVALMDQIEKVRIWEIGFCSHNWHSLQETCDKCGATKEEFFGRNHGRTFPDLPTPEAPKDETTAEEPRQEGGEEGPSEEAPAS